MSLVCLPRAGIDALELRLFPGSKRRPIPSCSGTSRPRRTPPEIAPPTRTTRLPETAGASRCS
eukprot:8955716-Prorocentrum_lima.AAC.1